jgi:hypothetical protein
LGIFSCVLACQAILGYLSSPILTTCQNHSNCVKINWLFQHVFQVCFCKSVCV